MSDLLHLLEPLLQFRYDQSLEDPRDGLTLFGPLDEGKPYGIRSSVIGTPSGIAAFRRWLERIQLPIIPRPSQVSRPAFPGFEVAFRTPLRPVPLAEITIPEDDLKATLYLDDSHQRVYRTVELFSSRIIEFHKREETLPDLWFVVIPDEVHRLCRPKSYVDRLLAIEASDTLPVS